MIRTLLHILTTHEPRENWDDYAFRNTHEEKQPYTDTIYSPNIRRQEENTRGARICPEADKLHRKTLNPYSHQYRYGAVIIIDNTPLGHIKYQGQESFLSYQNVQNDAEQVLIKGGLYRIEREVANKAREHKKTSRPDKWKYLTVDNTFFEPARMIGQTIKYARKPQQKILLTMIDRELKKIEQEINGARARYQNST